MFFMQSQCTEQCWKIRTGGLSLLLPEVELAAVVGRKKYNITKEANNFDCYDWIYSALFLSYTLTEFCSERCEYSEILEM